MEIDLILAFEDIQCEIDEALLVGVEVKYFKGFDGVLLWHAFHSDLPDEIVRSYSKATERLIDELKLPVFYLATRLVPQINALKLECFAPVFLYEPMGLDYFARWMKKYFAEKDNRNPMRQYREVERRRSTIKTLLGIPV